MEPVLPEAPIQALVVVGLSAASDATVVSVSERIVCNIKLLFFFRPER